MASRWSNIARVLGLSVGSAVAGAVVATALAPAWKRRRRRRRVGSALPKAPGAGSCIYLDVNATCPIYPDVADASAPFFREFWGNPSSPHAYGRPCKEAVTLARSQIAGMLNCKASEVVFCGCGSEADNWAILGAIELLQVERPHIVTSNIEHPAILRCVEALVKAGKCEATVVACDTFGYVAPEEVAAAVRPGATVLVSIMLANNEVGSVQDVASMARLCKARGGSHLFHTDAAQACGKTDVDVSALGVDLCTVVGHKFGAPKGVAALFVKEGILLPPMLRGGGQEAGRRAGTECVPLVVALGEAAAIWSEQGPEIKSHMLEMRDLLLERLKGLLGDARIRINGGLKESRETLPNTLSIGIHGAVASRVLASLSETVAASAGAACHEASTSVSEVLQAMNVPLEYAKGTLRLSVGRHTTRQDVEGAAMLIAAQCR